MNTIDNKSFVLGMSTKRHIDEDKLNELAEKYVKQEEQYIRSTNDKVWNAYVQGYRKAMEE